MVYAYLHHLPKAPRGQQRTIFLEPRLESGCPDVVAVYWSTAVTRRWDPKRVGLTPFHAQILHFLYVRGPVTRDIVRKAFGPRAERVVEELVSGGLVTPKRNARIAVRQLRQIFALRRIVALEAKIGSRLAGLQQAAQNQWFASESYLLLRALRSDTYFVEECRSHGVGIVTADVPLSSAPLPAAQGVLPRSYVSWLFNEWCWRTYQQLNTGTDGL